MKLRRSTQLAQGAPGCLGQGRCQTMLRRWREAKAAGGSCLGLPMLEKEEDVLCSKREKKHHATMMACLAARGIGAC